MQVGVGVLEGLEAVLHRHQDPDVVGCARAPHVGADDGGEEPARTRQQRSRERLGNRQCPHGVGVGLLLEGDGEDPLVTTGSDEMGGHDGRGPAYRPRRVDTQHGLAHRAQGRSQVQLGHHDALEHVGGLADHHGVDVTPVEPGVLEGACRRLAHEPRDRDVLSLRGVLGLAHPDHRAALGHHAPFPAGPEGSAARAHTRFCWRHGPEVACAMAVRALPSMMRAAASPMRTSPATIERVGGQRAPRRVHRHRVGQAERVAQDELLMGEGGVQLGHVDVHGARGVARGVEDARALRRQPGRGGRGQVARARGHAPRCGGRCR